MNNVFNNIYLGKKVLVTGHTGFKGSWLCKILNMAGAEVMGFAQEPNNKYSLFNILNIEDEIYSVIGDIRDLGALRKNISSFKPEIIFHLAAQPIVIESYRNPVYTYETNVMGTVNLLESIRECENVHSVVNITTDKVYKNKEWDWGYRENDILNGYDPYSNSKSCSELVTSSYKNSFFKSRNDISISTARAGNVIGGGDFSVDRIIPDCIRAAVKGEDIILRNPNSVRPYQHVFEALSAYLLIAEAQYGNKNIEDAYNVGPNDEDCITTGNLADIFCDSWGNNIRWTSNFRQDLPHEANFLKLECSKIRNVIGWKPKMDINEAVNSTIEWSKEYFYGDDVKGISEMQIKSYFNI